MTGPFPPPDIPVGRGADRPPEDRGVERDGVRLLVSTPERDDLHTFSDLVELLRPRDVLVVNESATLAASLPARGEPGEFLLNLSTPYGPTLWVAEPRWASDRPGPLPLRSGESIEMAGIRGTWVARFPGIPRLGFVRSEGDLGAAMRTWGTPIRYGYAAREFPLEAYQTVFSRVPGSAEMPSAGRPFTPRLLRQLRENGVGIATIVLHAGVSSLEFGDVSPGVSPVFPEPFEVPPETVATILRARANCGRVIAVGTTVVRAIESASLSGTLRPARGFTRVYLGPHRPVRTVDGLITGFHEARSTHLMLLSAVVGESRLRRAYAVAAANGYLWHEFGDSHLLLVDRAA